MAYIGIGKGNLGKIGSPMGLDIWNTKEKKNAVVNLLKIGIEFTLPNDNLTSPWAPSHADLSMLLMGKCS